MEKDCFKSLIQPFDISVIHLDDITVPDIEKYMHKLRNAKHDDKYYSSSSLNRAMRLVKAVLDDYYRHSERRIPAADKLLQIADDVRHIRHRVGENPSSFIRRCMSSSASVTSS